MLRDAAAVIGDGCVTLPDGSRVDSELLHDWLNRDWRFLRPVNAIAFGPAAEQIPSVRFARAVLAAQEEQS